jgi:P27 family predicted phage terminase small subunit
MAGRHPVPTALKIVRGNPGKRPLNRREPVAAGGPGECPFHGDLEPAAAAACGYWHELVAIGVPIGLFTATDRHRLIDYCRARADLDRARAMVEAQGEVIDDARYGPRPSPWWRVAQATERRVSQLGDSLGLAPVHRARVSATVPAVADDPIDQLRRGELPPGADSGEGDRPCGRA